MCHSYISTLISATGPNAHFSCACVAETLVAGKTTDYVNAVIKKVEDGDPRGGLPVRTKVRK